MTSELATLPDILHKLLYSKDFRETFILEGPQASSLGIPQRHQRDLQSVDIDELTRAASRIRSILLRGQVDDNGGIRASYPRTLAFLSSKGMSESDLCNGFQASDAFTEFREVPYQGRGVCLPESFYQYVKDAGYADNEQSRFLLTHEFLIALMRMLATGAGATFDVRSELVKQTEVAWYAVIHHDSQITSKLFDQPTSGDYIYAAGTRGLITGPCPNWLPGIIDGDYHADSRRIDRVRSLGLLPHTRKDGN